MIDNEIDALPPNLVRHEVRRRDDFRCIDCGMTQQEHLDQYGEQLHVHRKVPGKSGGKYTLANCETLCHEDHWRRHGRLPKKKRPKRDGVAMMFWIPEDVMEQLRWCQANLPGRPSMRSMVVGALRDHLKKLRDTIPHKPGSSS